MGHDRLQRRPLPPGWRCTPLCMALSRRCSPLTVYETVQALGYHHLGDLYTENHQVLLERALKRRVPARKGIPELRAWLARHAAVLVPLLREPTPRWQAATKDWIPRAVPTHQAEVVVGGRAAKTTRMEMIYDRGQPLWMTAALQDTMEAAGWAPEPRVCQQPPGTLPSNTRLHRLLVALLDIQVQVDAPLHAQLWGDHRQESLAQLQRTGVRAPTVVWATAPPTAAYWNWASTSQAPLVTVTSTLPPFLWIAISPAAVARFQYPAECMAHKCPGHPHKGPLLHSLDTVGSVPAELHQALRTHLREHHGDMALLAPHGRATSPPRVLAPETRPGVWFHDLPALATLRGSVVAVDAGATQAGMAIAGVVQRGPGEYRAQVASGVGTSQKGEVIALPSYARRLATQQGVYWLVPDSEAAMGALRTYQGGGHCGDGIHHLYATVLGGQRLSPRSAINVVTTPSHWITDLNVRVDAATREPPEVDLTWLLRRPYSFIPSVPFRDQCQLSLTALSDWLQDRASISAQAIYEGCWGVNFMPEGGHLSTGSITTSSATSRRIACTRSRPWPSWPTVPPTGAPCWIQRPSCAGHSPRRRPTCGPARLNRTSGGQPAGASQRCSTRRWGHGLPQCITSCGNRLCWSSGRQPCGPPPCSWPTWSVQGPTRWARSSSATLWRSAYGSGTQTPRRVPHC